MKKSEILREAKQHLYTGTDADLKAFKDKEGFQYICWAIDHVTYKWPDDRRDYRKEYSGFFLTREWIPFLFGDKNIKSLEHWLVKNKYASDFKSIKYKDAQATRHRWIDWMIKYWEKKERANNP